MDKYHEFFLVAKFSTYIRYASNHVNKFFSRKIMLDQEFSISVPQLIVKSRVVEIWNSPHHHDPINGITLNYILDVVWMCMEKFSDQKFLTSFHCHEVIKIHKILSLIFLHPAAFNVEHQESHPEKCDVEVIGNVSLRNISRTAGLQNSPGRGTIDCRL